MMNDEQHTHDDVLTGVGSAAGIPDASSQSRSAGEASPDVSDDDQPGDETTQEPPPRNRWSFLTEMVVLFVVALTIALLIKTFVVQPFFIPSASMEDTLLIGDKVLVNKLVYHLRPISRGDIVVFNGTGSWNPPATASPRSSNPVVRVYDDTLGALFHSIAGLFGTSTDQIDYIKRVIGIPGDHIDCCNARGQITVNGVPLKEGSYLIPGAQPSQYPFHVVVPSGRIWVMGDNRPASADSRLHDCAYSDPAVSCLPYDRDGTVPESKVIGRAFMIVWPPYRIRILPIPAAFGQRGLEHAAMPASSPAGTAMLSSGAVPVRPSGPYLPLAAGLVGAIPVTALERWLRLRYGQRRLAGRSQPGQCCQAGRPGSDRRESRQG